MQRSELVAALADELHVAEYSDGQENGLQIEGRPDIARIATAVSVNQETIDAANAWGADALLTHHGLLWKNEPLHVQGLRRKRLASILGADLNLLTYHLPLDAHPVHGNNAALATAAGCTTQGPAFSYKGPTIGIIGELPEAMRFEAWRTAFEGSLRADCQVETGPFQVWPHGADEVRRIGFISGAAPYQVHDAIDAGCDVYVTGESTEGVYHVAKEAGIHFIAGGHYLTERLGVQRLGAWCAERFGLEHRFFDVETRA